MRFSGLGIIAVAILALEIVGMTVFAARFGVLWMLFGLLLGFGLGISLLRAAGQGLAAQLMGAMQHNAHPLAMLWRVGRHFLAGLLLLFPGFFSDALALLILVTAGWPRRMPSTPSGPGSAPHPPGGPTIIEGEYRRED